MKRIFSIIVMIALAVSAAQARNPKGVTSMQMTAIFKEAKGYEGVDVMRIGPVATAAARGAMKLSLKGDGDPDARAAAKILDGLKRMAIMDFSDASDADKAALKRKIDKALSGVEMLTEMKDDSSSMRIYGLLDEGSDMMKDLVMYAEKDCALICLFGSISLDEVAKLVSQ